MDWQQTTSKPTDEAIEAVIQQATSALPYTRSNPLRDTRTQLFVGNLPYRVRWQDLKDLFRKAGTVLRADVSLGPDNRSRGYGTVLLATAEDAGRAVDTFNGYSWQSRILEVRLDRQLQDFDSSSVGTSNSNSYLPLLPSVPKSPSITDDPDYPAPLASDLNSCRSLFVGNLPFHCQWQDLKDLFRQAGTIIRADVVLGPDGRSRGFGTVIFATDLDAERALKMFDGYEFNGRVLNVHHDKYSYSSQPPTTSASPVGGSSSGVTSHSHPTHITLPPGYMLDLVPSSGPTSPYDMSKYQQRQHLHDQHQQQHQHQRQIQIQQLHLQLQQQEQEQRLLHQQYQHHQQQQQHQNQRHQQLQLHRNLPYDTPSPLDIENPLDTVLKPATFTTTSTTSTHYSTLPSSSSSSSSRPSSTSTPATTKRPIPIYKPPSLSHTNTSSGSDRSGSEMFSRLSSTSVTSTASSVSEGSLSKPHSEGHGQSYSCSQVPGQGHRARGQPFQNSSPHPVSSPEPSRSASASVPAPASSHPHPYPHSGSHHRSFPPHSPSPRAPSFQSSLHPTSTSTCRSSSRPSTSNPNHHPQHPGPISLPPPLLPSQVAFSIPLQQLSPHGHTPLGMSVSVSVSPLVEYPGGYGYVSGQYQQFGQHTIPIQATTPHGLPPITPSMPSFTFFPPALAPGLHATPTGTSPRVGVRGRGSGGHRRRSRSKSLARRLKMESELGNVGDDENGDTWNNSNNANTNASVSGRHSSSPSVSPSPPPSSARQRHHHHQQQQHIPTQDRQSYYQIQPSRRSVGGGSNTQPPPNVSHASNQPRLQPMPMHINLTSVPGAFSPGVVMSPGTFYGRPGEAPTFINAAVGAPLTMRADGSGGSSGVASEVGGPAGVAAQMQGQAQQGQWYHQNQTHGAHFYAMSSPTRRTPTGMEPKGYFDPLYFPAGVSVGGYNSSVVNEIMRDGHAHSLGVEVVGPGPEGKEGTRKEEGTHISDDGDGNDEEDSGAGDAEDDGDSDECEENQKIQSPFSEGEDGDRKLTTVALFGNSGETCISRTQSLPAPDVPHDNHRHTRRSTEKGVAGVLGFQSDSEEALENARSAQIPKKAGSTPMLGGGEQQQQHRGGGCGQNGKKYDELGLSDIPPTRVPCKTTPTTSASLATSLKENGDSSLI